MMIENFTVVLFDQFRPDRSSLSADFFVFFQILKIKPITFFHFDISRFWKVFRIKKQIEPELFFQKRYKPFIIGALQNDRYFSLTAFLCITDDFRYFGYPLWNKRRICWKIHYFSAAYHESKGHYLTVVHKKIQDWLIGVFLYFPRQFIILLKRARVGTGVPPFGEWLKINSRDLRYFGWKNMNAT